MRGNGSHMSETAPASTGIEGLDEILGGGLPRGRMYLIEGDPGVGKTTVALQFLLEGARRGERVLYVTLAETEAELRQVARSHGWNLEGVEVFASVPDTADLAPEEDYSVFGPAEVELGETMKKLLAEVDRVKPARVVFDSLSEFRLIAQQPLRYRRQLMALKQHFAGTTTTVLLLDDFVATEGNADRQLESLAHGVLRFEQMAPAYGRERRRMIVKKLRGLRFRGGYHDCTIETGGLRVYPRVVAAEHGRSGTREVFSTGLAELDTLLGGGFDRGTATLIMGPAGTGKSVLVTQSMCAAAARGERSAAFLFDEGIESFVTRAEGLGMPIAAACDAGLARAQSVDPAELAPGEFASRVKTAVERDGVRLVAVDSLNGYMSAMPEERFLLAQLHELFSYLSHKGVVTLICCAQHGLVGASDAPMDVSYLADNVVLLRYFEAQGLVRNAISVVKRRRGPHEKTIRELTIAPPGMQVGAPLAAFQGVLTGVPTFVGRTESLTHSDER